MGKKNLVHKDSFFGPLYWKFRSLFLILGEILKLISSCLNYENIPSANGSDVFSGVWPIFQVFLILHVVQFVAAFCERRILAVQAMDN
jgi:hypothetical protein